jgi:DNA-binding NtrC family response regulator
MDPEILFLGGESVPRQALSRLVNLNMHVASDALQAISFVQNHSYIALLIDEAVGYVDGWALLRYLDENQVPIERIVVSASGGPAGFEEEFDAVHRVHLDDLAELLEKIVTRFREEPVG